ncbi:RNA polymerase sigma factor [Bacteroides faecichinchillae]|uniref:RNA polymerase sigma factor n=1 Tax=Bacteroides faecichinchillae TaxID=871325 RepID=UPI003515B23A
MKQESIINNEDEQSRELAELIEAERTHLLRYACYRIGNLVDAEDAIQDIFVQLHTREKDHKSQTPANMRNYLYRSLANLCTDRLRKVQYLQFVSLEQVTNYSEDTPEDFEQEFRLISTLLATIPEEQAEVIRLRIHSDKSFAEIAEILDMPVSSVKSRFQYGIEKIRKGLKEQQSLKVREQKTL